MIIAPKERKIVAHGASRGGAVPRHVVLGAPEGRKNMSHRRAAAGIVLSPLRG